MRTGTKKMTRIGMLSVGLLLCCAPKEKGHIKLTREREILWREYGIDVYQDGRKIASIDTFGNGYFVRTIVEGRIVVATNVEKWKSKATETRRFIYQPDGSATVVTYGDGLNPIDSFNTKDIQTEK